VKSYLIMSREAMEKDEYGDSLEVLRKAKDIAAFFTTEAVKEKARTDVDSSIKLASITRLQRQQREVKKQILKALEKKKEILRKEKARAKAMFGGGGGVVNSGTTNGVKPASSIAKENGRNSSPPKDTGIDDTSSPQSNGLTTATNTTEINIESDDPFVDNPSMETVEQMMNQRDNSGNNNMSSSLRSVNSERRRKSVSFNPKLEERKIIAARGDEKGGVEGDDLEGDEDKEPWYEEHKEALILLAIGGVAAVSSIFMRGAKR